ncbi:hypothetical protein AND_002893 [Anopheles darlingi]|uniref:Secreted protein n=1 Tax=Anopheles darlingi TaxID=43151 RepID=W5JPV1_ANODA|nr:hypothetical protein AND_002893 [Anopheles darlingi]
METIHYFLVLLILTSSIAEDKRKSRQRRFAGFLTFPGGGFGVGVNYNADAFRFIPGFTLRKYDGPYSNREPDEYATFTDQ